VDENMKRAENLDALNKEKFWFRKDMLMPLPSPFPPSAQESEDDIVELSIKDIMLGYSSSKCSKPRDNNPQPNSGGNNNDEECEFGGDNIAAIGFIPLVHKYLDDNHCKSGFVRDKINSYLEFIESKLHGKIPTTATFLRNEITRHPKYKHDSVVSEEIAYDVIKMCEVIGNK
jgi:glutamate--cysteine ligase catalytic subunit